jgi:multidrug efflux pump subunit AcrA (membrane-fusion protein)
MVEASPGIMSVTLPGTTAAFAAANIYARATGYIAKRNVDIGDRVKAGDLLAELSVPELDDQISQNEATLNQLKVSAGAGGGQPTARGCDVGSGQTVGQERLGDRAAGHSGRPESQGAGG